ncbi:MAG: zinc-binding dehydrogenase [Gemmataceae bacterium]
MSTTKQQCAYLIEPGQIELRGVPVPVPAAGQILIRIDSALAGGTDRKAFLRGHPQIPMPGPFGHRYTGTVAAIGAGVDRFTVGQPVMGVHSAPCLQCALCRKGRPQLCPDVMKEKVLGAFAEYLLVPAPIVQQNLFERPGGLKPEHAVFLEPLACVVHGLSLLDFRGVENVLVIGLGSMGLLFLQLLPGYTQAARFATGRHQARVELARRFGADARELMDNAVDDRRFDCVIECTGQLAGWREAAARVAPGGQVLLYGGVPRGTSIELDTFRLHYEEMRVLGSFHFAPRDVAAARQLLLSGRLDLDSLISGQFPLARLADALHGLGSGAGMQYLIEP